MSDKVGKPEDQFSRVAAPFMSINDKTMISQNKYSL